MTQEELDALTQKHGGLTGTTSVGPDKQVDPDLADVPGGTSESLQVTIPDEKRQHKLVFKDGSTLTVNKKDDGSYNVVTPLADKAPDNTPILRVLPDGSIGQYDPETRTFTAVTGSKLSPQEIEANKDKAVHDKAEREYNSTHPGPDGHAYYLTHDELAKLQATQKTQSLDDKRATAQIANFEADNKRADAQIKISQQNADTAGRAADTASSREERLTAAAEKQATAEKAAQDLAQKKFEWDQKVKAGEMSAEEAWREYQKEYNATKAKAEDARLALDAAIAANNESNSVRTDETTRRGQDVTTRGQDLSNTVETGRTAETERHNRELEQETVYDRAARIGESAAKTATDSLQFMAPAGTSADLAGIRNGMLSNPAAPQAGAPARSVPFPWDPTQLVQQLTAQALAGMSPAAQQAITANRTQQPSTPAPPILPSSAEIAASNTSAGLPPGMTSATSGPGSAQLPTGTPGTQFQTFDANGFRAPTGSASTTIAPDGTVTIQHVAPQSDPNYAATVADPTEVRGFR